MVNSFPPKIVEQTQVVIIGGDHFFTGHLPELDSTISSWLLERHTELAEQEVRE
jgi:alpha/beta superfamily hydrolase